MKITLQHHPKLLAAFLVGILFAVAAIAGPTWLFTFAVLGVVFGTFSVLAMVVFDLEEQRDPNLRPHYF